MSTASPMVPGSTGSGTLFFSMRSVVASAVRAFFHAAALGAVATAAFGAGRPAAFIVAIVFGVVAASRSKRVGVELKNGELFVSNYFRTVVLDRLDTIRIHEYSRNRLELESENDKRTLVQAANYWSEGQRTRFLDAAHGAGMRDADHV